LLSDDDFNTHDTIILKSDPGTGKTTAVANCIKQYLTKNEDTKFLTITTRTTLTAQHEKSFKNINLKNYQTSDINEGGNLSICLNSLHKLRLDDNIKNYVVYIDEVASFLEFTHNDTLDNNIQTIYTSLINIVKYAKKVIVSDALINDNVINFLKHRKNKN
jgi:superfamily II DNA or RNA helicase